MAVVPTWRDTPQDAELSDAWLRESLNTKLIQKAKSSGESSLAFGKIYQSNHSFRNARVALRQFLLGDFRVADPSVCAIGQGTSLCLICRQLIRLLHSGAGILRDRGLN